MYKNKAESGKNNICGERVKAIRKSLPGKTSQRELADMLQRAGLDVDKNAVQRIESGHMSVASCIEMGRANWKRYRMGRELFGLRLDNRAWRRDFGKYIQYDMPIEYGYLAANGAFDKNNADELTLTRRGRYLVLVMMRQIFIGMNTERDRLRTQLPADERKMFSDSAERQIAAAQAADAE